MLFTCIVFVLVQIGAEAQVPFFGKCPDFETSPNFDLNRYLGKWFEAERYFSIFEFGGKCVTANYSYNSNGAVNILNQQISALTGMKSSINGLGNSVGRSDEAKFAINFPSFPVFLNAPYWILDTDYDNYAVVWSCNDFGIFNTRNAWILTRMKNPSLKTMELAYSVLDKNSISRAYFIRTDQKNCPYIKNNS